MTTKQRRKYHAGAEALRRHYLDLTQGLAKDSPTRQIYRQSFACELAHLHWRVCHAGQFRPVRIQPRTSAAVSR